MMGALDCRPGTGRAENVPTSHRPFPNQTTADGSGLSELLHRL